MRQTSILSIVLLLASACAEDGPPPDPSGTVTSQLVLEGVGPNSLDFETGVVATEGGDLSLDSVGNFVALDQIADLGDVAGLGSIQLLPEGGFLTSVAATEGHGFVVKSSASKAYAVVVDSTLVSATSGGLRGYVLKWAPLSVAVVTAEPPGSGFGAVVSVPAGIDCVVDFDNPPNPWDCAEPFNVGTQVTMTAEPRTISVADYCGTVNSVFSGWQDDLCSGTDVCVVNVDQDVSVLPNFERTTPVRATIGTGDGTITSSVGGIDCGATCTTELVSGTEVTVTAVPVDGQSFQGWWFGAVAPNQPGTSCAGMPANFTESHACIGVTDASCTFTVPGNGQTGTELQADFQ